MISLGLMSGTSMDGIDAALIETDGEFHVQSLAHLSLPYKNLTKQDVLDQTTALHAQLIEKILKKNKIAVDVIGYHGQTTYHNPAEKKSIQLGDPQHIANQFKIPVVFNFRQNDLHHGGQGAPLAPLYHHALMVRDKLDNLAVVNIGGIANVSLLTKGKILGGFDTGPGNILIDRCVRKHVSQKYDHDGQFGLQGKIHLDVIEKLFNETIPLQGKAHSYYVLDAPKSLDINDIVYPEILNTLSLYDGCATLAAFTALTIAKSIPDFIKHVVVSGGGGKNPLILKCLKQYLPKGCTVKIADDMGWSTTYMEAELMAWLAVRSMKKLPLTIPETTGVEKPMTGGDVFYPG